MTNLATLLTDSARRAPESPALRLGELSLSYGQLDALSAAFAQRLHEAGVGVGDRVALVAPNAPQMPVAYYAILRLGAVVVPLSPLLSARELTALFRTAELSAVVVHDAVSAPAEQACAELEPSVPLLLLDQQTLAAPSRDLEVREPVERAADDLAVLLFTSGTTGEPKGAALTHDNVTSNAWMTTRMFSYVPEDVILGALPFFHVFGQTVCLNAPVAVGACISLVPSFQPRTVLQQLGEHGVTRVIGVPSMHMALCQVQARQPLELPSLDSAISGGAALPVEVLRRFEQLFGITLYEGYGLSETSPVVAFNQPVHERVPGSIGTPVEEARVAILDDDGRELPRGEIGELAVAGRYVMAGYWKQPELTAAAFAGEYFRTGDMARQDEDDRLWIVDRKKDTILRNGYNVYPREIEELIYEHPGVEEAAVVGRGGATTDQQVVACLVLRDGAQEAEVIEQLRATMRESLASYKRPQAYKVVDALPKGSTGKILKREIDPS